MKEQDGRFPVGHTCGNMMDLPHYSSKSIMKERLLTAINLCGEIDDDGDYSYAIETVNEVSHNMQQGVDENMSDGNVEVQNWDFDDAESQEEDLGEWQQKGESDDEMGDADEWDLIRSLYDL